MKTPTKTLMVAAFAVALLACAAFAPQAQAVPINGAVTFSGAATLNGPILTATGVMAFSNTVVQTASGSFATTLMPNDPATFSAPWIFVNAQPMLWSAGGFTFDLAAGSIVTRPIIGGIQFLIVSGSGTVSGNGFDPTAGIFSFTTQNPSAGGKFSFSAATAAVPDGGSAVALLGVALAGVEILRRKLRTV